MDTKVLIAFFMATFTNQVLSQLVSPCPRLFRYETQNQENDRWYGVVTLLSDAELSGVWLRLIFDKPSLQLGNWFGEVVTQDNKEYLVKNRNHKLTANKPYNLRFYLKYNPGETPPPQLVSFRLNAKTVCPEGEVTTEATTNSGQLLTSPARSTTETSPIQPVVGGIGTGGSSFTIQGGGFQRPSTGGDDDDFFQGDFAIFTKPKPSGVDNNFEVACGTVISAPRPLITHGQSTQEGEFPWHAALYHAKGIDLAYFCGASLISKQHLITVAHCVSRRRTQTPISPDDLVVYLGKYYLRRWSNPGIQSRHIDKITIHSQYNPQTYSNDIAVMRLSTPVKITDYVRPICLWEDDVNLNTVVGKLGTVAGWGFDENGKVTEQLTKAQMPIVSQETCIYSFPDFYSRFTSSKTFCAGFKNGTSVCNGDSGGGIVLPKTTTSNRNAPPVWQLRGLVSISVALQNQLKCDSSHYVVFTDVAKYLDWIRASLN